MRLRVRMVAFAAESARGSYVPVTRAVVAATAAMAGSRTARSSVPLRSR